MIDTYKSLQEKHLAIFSRLSKQHNFISILRLVWVGLIGVGLYYGFTLENKTLFAISAAGFLAFIVLLKYHQSIGRKKKMEEALTEINKREIDYLKGVSIPFEDGAEFYDAHHPYALDLDIFGPASLFRHLNRTATWAGARRLADLLLNIQSKEEILRNQAAIQELIPKIEWRQRLLAMASMKRDNKTHYEQLLAWNSRKVEELPKSVILLSYLMPVLFFISFFCYLFDVGGSIGDWSVYFFIANLLLFGSQTKRFRQEMMRMDQIHTIINQYGLILGEIETEVFRSEKLNALKAELNNVHGSISGHIKKLSSLIAQMDSILNIYGTVLFNGSFLYHVHTLRGLYNWRSTHRADLEKWLQVMAEFEALNSLANFAYNNPDFVFATLNDHYHISFKNLAHPLIKSSKRVGSDVSFQPQRLIVLTGSNMSGKSTFLRALGINMILTGLGSVVCARSANVHPLPVLPSMRLEDSLADSESYFFAEVKRLQGIIEKLDAGPAFVLLDEILRGTNSDDKRNGTIQVLKKLMSKHVIGAIATHDLEVCHTTTEHPTHLTNKCFEVEIINDELYFDYKLRDGICQNKSASFLMKKMGVID